MNYIDACFIDNVFVNPTRWKDYDNDLIPYQRIIYVVIKPRYRSIFSSLKFEKFSNSEIVNMNRLVSSDMKDFYVESSYELNVRVVVDPEEIIRVNRDYIKWSPIHYDDTIKIPVNIKGSIQDIAKLKLMM